MTSWRLASVLLVLTAALFAVGVAIEGASDHVESTDGRAVAVVGDHDEAGEDTEGSAEHKAVEGERVLGLAAESGWTVAAAVVVSVVLAAGLWFTRRRWLAAIVALVAVGFAVFDIGELMSQIDEHRIGLAVLAAAVAVGHVVAGFLAGRPAELRPERADSWR